MRIQACVVAVLALSVTASAEAGRRADRLDKGLRHSQQRLKEPRRAFAPRSPRSSRPVSSALTAACLARTSAGSEFRLSSPHVMQGTGGSLLVVMSDAAADLNITVPRCIGSPYSMSAAPGSPAILQVCADATHQGAGQLSGRGIQVELVGSTEPILHVVLFAPDPASGASDAYMALPNSELGNSYRPTSYPPGTPRAPLHSSRFTAVATEPGTILNYTSCAGSVTSTPPMAAGDSFQLRCFQPNQDPTGKRVWSEGGEPFALTSGATGARVPDSEFDCCVDPLTAMALPIAADASIPMNDYLTAEFLGETESVVPGDLFRVIAVDGPVEVSVDAEPGAVTDEGMHGRACLGAGSPYVFNLDAAGDWCELHLDGGTHLASIGGERFLVSQIMKGRDQRGTGDPSLVSVVPTNMYSCHHRFFSFSSAVDDARSGTFVNIIAPAEGLGSTLLDGLRLDDPAGHCGDFVANTIPGSDFAYATCRLPAPPATPELGEEHVVHGQDEAGDPVGVGVYAYGQEWANSYAYVAGLGFPDSPEGEN